MIKCCGDNRIIDQIDNLIREYVYRTRGDYPEEIQIDRKSYNELLTERSAPKCIDIKNNTIWGIKLVITEEPEEKWDSLNSEF